ncbi:alpha/beta hydrolase [Aequorivita sp. H23M31]|uniref:Alpha/beta hydrolase n=1 Tax=Aequorivita ciconiae TaxID=2494375 RepID=A0A410G4I1_9FLAO|nr:alpha/beta hydrolase [Aequorivita sp. H23M31]QAA82149.1 alpha/beta hydrolase [Aequorivita sp. H23M31]
MILNFKNTNIYYNSVGKGPAVVLLHGFLESSAMWATLIPELSQDRQVITLDFPGLGESGVISEIHSMELLAEVVNEVFEHLQVKKASFVGHSMGGYVSMAFADLFPMKIEKLVLLNSTPISDSEERKDIRDRAVKLVDKNPEAFVRMAIVNWAGETSREKFSKEIEDAYNLALTFPVEGVKAALKGMRDRKDRTDVLKSFPREKYMFLAEDDPIIPVDDSLKLAEECDVNSIVVSGGHLSLIENFPSVREFLLSIL